MPDKSFVTLEQRQCMICGKIYDTGELLMDTRMKKRFDMHTVTGLGLCPEHQELFDKGFVALVEADPEKSAIKNDTSKPEDAYRTGNVAWVKREVLRQIIDKEIPDDLPMMYVTPGVIDKIRSMTEGGGIDLDAEKEKPEP